MSPTSRRTPRSRSSDPARPPLPRAERRLLWVLSAHLVFLPLAVGTTHAWAQQISLALGLVGLLIALLPRVNDAELGLERTHRSPWGRLRRFPPFWLGLLLFAYIAVQIFNVGWAFRQSGVAFWFEKAPAITWLPSGVDAPFNRFNGFRELIIYGAAWLVMCAGWAGLTRRKSLRVLAWVCAINALVVTSVIFAQQALGNGRWPWPLTEATFRPLVGTFIYKNHAGAYLVLTSMALLLLAATSRDRSARGSRRSSPAIVFILLVVFVAAGVVFTLSRAATLLMGLTLMALVVWYVLRSRRDPAAGNPWLALVPVGLIGGFAVFAGANVDFSKAVERFNSVIEKGSGDYSVATREVARDAGLEMLADYRWTGVGAGGFRHVFPIYQQKYPVIYVYQGKRMYWEYLHNDWVELPIELGLAGCAILAAGGVWWLHWLWRRRGAWATPWTILLVGLAQTLAHAWYDFPFQNPAILTTWFLLLVAASKGLDIERE